MNEKNKETGFQGKPNEEKNNNGKGPIDKKILLTLIVSGTATSVDAIFKQKLRVIVEKALNQTGNTGRGIDSWTLKTRDGVVLALDKTVEEYKLIDGTELILSLQAGAGGY